MFIEAPYPCRHSLTKKVGPRGSGSEGCKGPLVRANGLHTVCAEGSPFEAIVYISYRNVNTFVLIYYPKCIQNLLHKWERSRLMEDLHFVRNGSPQCRYQQYCTKNGQCNRPEPAPRCLQHRTPLRTRGALKKSAGVEPPVSPGHPDSWGQPGAESNEQADANGLPQPASAGHHYRSGPRRRLISASRRAALNSAGGMGSPIRISIRAHSL